jgi:hypothetical protein
VSRVDDPYEHLSDAQLDAHVESLIQAGLPEPGRATESVVISLRMPQGLLDRLRAAATLRGEGYQTLMKRWLEERLGEDAGISPPPDLDALPDDIVSSVELSPEQVRTLAVHGELLLRLRSPARATQRRGTSKARTARKTRT